MSYLFGHDLFLCKLRYLQESVDNVFIAAFSVGDKAVGAVLYAVFGIAEIAAAVFAKSIEWTVAKQAIKAVCIRSLVTWEVFAVGVLKKAVIIFHRFAP